MSNAKKDAFGISFLSAANEEFCADNIECPVCSNHPKMERYRTDFVGAQEGCYRAHESIFGRAEYVTCSEQKMELKLRCPKCGSILSIPVVLNHWFEPNGYAREEII